MFKSQILERSEVESETLESQRLKFWKSRSQCRINNSSKYSNCYGPRVFGGRAVLYVKLFLIYAKLDIGM